MAAVQQTSPEYHSTSIPDVQRRCCAAALYARRPGKARVAGQVLHTAVRSAAGTAISVISGRCPAGMQPHSTGPARRRGARYGGAAGAAYPRQADAELPASVEPA